MASDVTLQSLVDLARLYSDQRPGGNTNFVVDTGAAGVVTLINGALAEFYDILVAAGGHEFYLKDGTVSVVANTAIYALPTDFYRLETATLEWATNDHEPLRAYELGERWAINNLTNWTRWSPKGYRLRGAQTLAADAEASIEFVPLPQTAVTCRLRYVPTFTPLASLSDTFSSINGWEKLICLKVAMELRMIAKQSYGDIMPLYQEQLERVQGLADKRSAQATPQVIDVETARGFLSEYAADRRWI